MTLWKKHLFVTNLHIGDLQGVSNIRYDITCFFSRVIWLRNWIKNFHYGTILKINIKLNSKQGVCNRLLINLICASWKLILQKFLNYLKFTCLFQCRKIFFLFEMPQNMVKKYYGSLYDLAILNIESETLDSIKTEKKVDDFCNRKSRRGGSLNLF